MADLKQLQDSHPLAGAAGSSACFLTVAEVARMLGFSTAAVYREVRRGNLDAYSLCGRLRIAPAALAEWLDARTVPAPTTTDRKKAVRPAVNPRGLLRPLLADGGQR